MFLQILPPDTVLASEATFNDKSLLIVLGIGIALVGVIKIVKLVTAFKFSKRPSFSA